jgi:hypothetical protein
MESNLLKQRGGAVRESGRVQSKKEAGGGTVEFHREALQNDCVVPPHLQEGGLRYARGGGTNRWVTDGVKKPKILVLRVASSAHERRRGLNVGGEEEGWAEPLVGRKQHRLTPPPEFGNARPEREGAVAARGEAGRGEEAAGAPQRDNPFAMENRI